MNELLLHAILWIKLKNNVKEKKSDTKEHIPANKIYMEFDSLFVALGSEYGGSGLWGLGRGLEGPHWMTERPLC